MTGKPNRSGRPADIVAQAWGMRFGFNYQKMAAMSRTGRADDLMMQLSLCKDDDARRVILGIIDGRDSKARSGGKRSPR